MPALLRARTSIALQPGGFRSARILWRFPRVEADRDDAGRKKALEEELKQLLPAGAVLKATDIKGWDSIEEPLIATFSLEVPAYAAVAGKLLMVPGGNPARMAVPPSLLVQDMMPNLVKQHMFDRKSLPILGRPAAKRLAPDSINLHSVAAFNPVPLFDKARIIAATVSELSADITRQEHNNRLTHGPFSAIIDPIGMPIF